MAGKKYYGVKIGKVTGVFDSWDDCKASVDGYPGAQYKGFPTLEEARAYAGVPREQETGQRLCGEPLPAGKGELTAYVDGSFHEGLGRYAFGCVFLVGDGQVYTQFGNGDNPQSLKHRNVTGEMLGAMYAVRTAMYNGYEAVAIYYDYEGIEKWVTGAWKSKTEYTRKYSEAMRAWGQQIRIRFCKVAAHTNVEWNELADQMAKKGITDGRGIPKMQKLEEMTQWNG